MTKPRVPQPKRQLTSDAIRTRAEIVSVWTKVMRRRAGEEGYLGQPKIFHLIRSFFAHRKTVWEIKVLSLATAGEDDPFRKLHPALN